MKCSGWNRSGCACWTPADVAIVIDRRAATSWLRTGRHEAEAPVPRFPGFGRVPDAVRKYQRLVTGVLTPRPLTAVESLPTLTGWGRHHTPLSRVATAMGPARKAFALDRPLSWSHEHDVAESAIPQTAAAWQPPLPREVQLGQAREHRRYRLRLLPHPRHPLPGRRRRQQG